MDGLISGRLFWGFQSQFLQGTSEDAFFRVGIVQVRGWVVYLVFSLVGCFFRESVNFVCQCPNVLEVSDAYSYTRRAGRGWRCDSSRDFWWLFSEQVFECAGVHTADVFRVFTLWVQLVFFFLKGEEVFLLLTNECYDAYQLFCFELSLVDIFRELRMYFWKLGGLFCGRYIFFVVPRVFGFRVFLRGPRHVFGTVERTRLGDRRQIVCFDYIGPSVSSVVLFRLFRCFEGVSIFGTSRSLAPAVGVGVDSLLCARLTSFRRYLVEKLRCRLKIDYPSAGATFCRYDLGLLYA